MAVAQHAHIAHADTGTGFLEAVSSGFSKAFTFRGRANRAEYIYFHLALLVMAVIMGLLAGVIGAGPALALPLLAMVIPIITITTRRLHDINRSGWFQLLSVVPVVGWLVFPALCVIKGTDGENDFG